MIYELRTYYAHPGKMDALNARFRDHTVGLFAKHGIEVVGFWVPEDAPDQLIYIVRFADRDAMKAAWDSFREDADWQQVRSASEADGPIVAKLESRVMDPTDYSAPLN